MMRRGLASLFAWLLLVGSCGDNNSASDDPRGSSDTDVDSDTDNVVDLGGLCNARPGQLFGPEYPWNQTVEDAALDVESDVIISFLQSRRDAWGTFQIDGPSEESNNTYGLVVLNGTEADRMEFTSTDSFYSPDCDPAPIPVPPGFAIEGEHGYACENKGDCHHLVVVEESCRLYEMWRADVNGDTFNGGCHAVWDMTAPYEETLRGECCTSADAAGLPISAMSFSADDIALGEINHALRSILPNESMRQRVYVRPATHSTGATSGPATAPPYGARLRLKADFDASNLNPAAQVVALALKEYGMILSDGGNITFTAINDRFTAHSWAQVGLGPHDLMDLNWTDFEVVELGQRFTFDDNCSCDRSPVTQ